MGRRLLGKSHEVRNLKTDGVRETQQGCVRDIPFASFDPAEETAIHPALERERLLREAVAHAKDAQRPSQRDVISRASMHANQAQR